MNWRAARRRRLRAQERGAYTVRALRRTRKHGYVTWAHKTGDEVLADIRAILKDPTK